MYLQPWQIFAGGCVCGALITFIVLIAILINLIKSQGVEIKKEEKSDG